MFSSLLKKFMTAIVTLVATIAVIFVITRKLGDPIALMLGPRATQEQIDFFREKEGLNDSIFIQFLRYIQDLLRFDFGNSISSGRTVLSEITLSLPATVELVIFATFLGIIIFVPLGIFAASSTNRFIRIFCSTLVRLGISIPSFWLGLVFIFIFYYKLEISPAPYGRISSSITFTRSTGFYVFDAIASGNFTALQSCISHLMLPGLTLALTSCVPILKLTTEVMNSILESEYIQTARNLGLSRARTVWVLAFKNALIPIVTMTAMTLGYLIGGTVLVETIFAWPGIGLYAVQSMYKLDYAPVLAVTIIATTSYIVVYFLADLFSSLIDPRIRKS